MANEIAKGAQALSKGMAMFAWMEPVRDALLEVGDLEKQLGVLHTRITRAEDAAETVEADLAALTHQKTGVDAEAAKLLADAKSQAGDILATAKAAARVTKTSAEATIQRLREGAEADMLAHDVFMEKARVESDELKHTLSGLQTAVAELKAKFR